MPAADLLLFQTSTAGYTYTGTSGGPSEVTSELVSGIVGVRVQAAFGFDASSELSEGAWVDLTNVVEVRVDRPASRNLGVLVRYEAGTCTVVLDNQSRDYDPANLSGTYVDGSGTQVLPMVPIRVIAQAPVDVDGDLVDIGGDGGVFDTDFPLFRGYADRWQVTYSARAKTSQTVLTATDGTKVLSRFNGPEQASQGSTELPGARITRILDNAGWPAELRDLETGVSQLQATTLAQPAWTELLLTADSERGDLFFDGQGQLVFFDQIHRSTADRSATVQADWDDADPDGLHFAAPSISMDETLIVNFVTIANVGGTEQNISDGASRTKYLTLSTKRSDLILTSDSAALSYAAAILARTKDPYLRVDGFTYSPGSLDEQYASAPTVLGAQPADRWKVRFTPPGGGDRIIQDVWVAGMSWRFKQATWSAAFTFQSITTDIDQGARYDDGVSRYDEAVFSY